MRTMVLGSDDGLEAVACWRPLAWDTEQFGFPAGRLDFCVAAGEYAAAREAKQALLDHVLDECKAEEIRHLIARTDAGDLSTIHALESSGFELVDGIQKFEREAGACEREACGFEVRLLRPEDRAQVLAIARTSYIYDRFHKDAALTREIADRVNEAWLENACSGAIADAVLVAEDAGSILGFVTCKMDGESRVGVIDMVATALAARRRGVAGAITAAALDWFAGVGAVKVEVGTQLTNIPAARLYQGFGFQPVAVSLTFRRVL